MKDMVREVALPADKEIDFEELRQNVVKAFEAKSNISDYDFEVNNQCSITTDLFAEKYHKVYNIISEDVSKELEVKCGLNPNRWTWDIKDAGKYLDKVYCIDRIINMNHPDFNYCENPYKIRIQIKASKFQQYKELKLPVKKSHVFENSDGKEYCWEREFSYLNNIDYYIWYHWCSVKRDTVIHILKKPADLFFAIQLERGHYKERIAGNPMKYKNKKDSSFQELLYLNPLAKAFPKENLIHIYNPHIH